jgi:hypothetical protein
MSTNQFWSAENIKAVASLWPLALFCFLILVLLATVIFFLPQTRNFLTGLKNFRFKFGSAEASMNQSSSGSPNSSSETPSQETTSGLPKSVEKNSALSDSQKQETLDLDPEYQMFLHLSNGMLDDAESDFKSLQLNEADPEVRTHREAVYLRLRFQKGDFCLSLKMLKQSLFLQKKSAV